MEALLRGRLIVVGDCIYIDQVAEGQVAVWPKGFRAMRVGGLVTLYSPDGTPVASEGDTISAGGGQIASTALADHPCVPQGAQFFAIQSEVTVVAQASPPGSDGAGAEPPDPDLVGIADRCPPPTVRTRYPDTGAVAPGAIGVRVCDEFSYPQGRPRQRTFIPPADLLTTEVDALAEAANALPKHVEGVPHEGEQHTFCTTELGPHYVFWFVYPDGDARAVTYGDQGCRYAMLAPHDLRKDGESLAELLWAALDAHRATTAPPQSIPALPECDNTRPLSDHPADVLDDIASAVYCLPTSTGVVPVRLNERQTQVLERDYQRNGLTPSSDDIYACEPVGVLVTTSSWGDQTLLSGSCDGFVPWTAPPGQDWKIDAATRAMLRQLEARPLAPPRVEQSFQVAR